MLPVSSEKVRERLIPVLKKLSLPTEYSGDINTALSYVIHDKKCSGGVLSVILCEEIGTYKIERIAIDNFEKVVLNYYN